jgi:CubicO group peptidase (beta-lactamase class C family)
MSAKPLCTWEKSKVELNTKLSIDSLVLANKHLQSFLVVQDDKIKYERYKKGFSESTAHNLKSATKSIVSLLTGIAIDKGYLTLNTNLKTLFGNEMKVDSLTGTVTIRNLLTMQGGFPYIDYYRLICCSRNPIKATLQKRRNCVPGDSTLYSDISANLLGCAVAKATKMKLEDFAATFLFSPLGIQYHVWVNDLKGNNSCAGDLFMCPRDFAKVGSLMLHKGQANGQQIVSEKWVAESISPKTTIPLSFKNNLEYGYLWWVDNKETAGAFCAIGFGGQILYISPLDNTIIVTTSSLSAVGWPLALETIRKVIKLNRAQSAMRPL